MEKFLIGKRISLHGLCLKDLDVHGPYYTWLDDLGLDLYTERSYFPNSEDRMRLYYQNACKNTDLILLGIFDNATEKHIGNITFQDINWISRRAFIAYLLGNSDFAGKGYVTEAVIMMMYYGFNRLNFNRIYGGVSAIHKASRRICEKVGLKEEGVMKGHFLRNGEYTDTVVVGALRDSWMQEYQESATSFFKQKPTY